ncbi:MAG: FMN-binding glutamate synthase family protein [bacterium]|nr:FMN-binding glutamate synthase family protein [Deltaproteobacteria bacterium]MCP4904653.1 FMN-binding glutamate synthase family protein [bacterium]
MNAILITLNVIVLASLAALGSVWSPALFAYLIVGPFAVLSLWGVSKGDISARTIFVTTAVVAIGGLAVASFYRPAAMYGVILVGPIVLLGLVDMLQRKRALRRNFPVIGHVRYLFETVRPEIQQYFVESDIDGRPFNREDRSLVYQRAKGARDTLPFGTQRDVYEVGYEWINHSIVPVIPTNSRPRVLIGEGRCQKPYSASLLNISAMSFGALSGAAIESLNKGAKEGGFAHNTGEGSISPHHLHGGDLIWQIGTGYFGCRNADGGFDEDSFSERSQLDQVKMIEIKISQGAKPGHGGILPAAKITPEVSAIRGVPMGADVVSPPGHGAFSTPIGLLEFVTRLRDLSGGKPVGFKLCVGKQREFLAICRAMLETGLVPDFITVDGGEGGTGAAPFEFSNSLGSPLIEGLTFVHNALVGIGLRDQIKIIASGRVSSGFGIARMIALGADLCNSARAMMMSMGCIQARRCNTNDCPVGIATQNPALTGGLVVEQKYLRVARYHGETVHAAIDLMGAAGLATPQELRPWHIIRRISQLETRHYGEIVEFLEPGAILRDELPEGFARAWRAASASSFICAVNPIDVDGFQPGQTGDGTPAGGAGAR